VENAGNFSEEYYDRLDRYLDQSMPAEERRRFEEECAADAGLQYQLDRHRLVRIAIMEKNLSSAMAGFPQPGRVRSITTRKWLAAASLVILASAAYLFFSSQRHDPAKLYGRFYHSDPGLMTTMGSADDYDFQVAMIQYKRGDYAGAAGAWKKLLPQRPSSDTLQYFLGCAYQAQNSLDTAFAFFQPVAANPNSAFYKEACWYAGLIRLRQNRISEAVALIRQSDRPEKDSLLNEIPSRADQ